MKKMTKILSLVLALAMVLGMTALADGTIYFMEDFDYEDGAAFYNAEFGSGISYKTVNASLLFAAKTEQGKNFYASSSNGAGISATGGQYSAAPVIWTNSAGNKMVSFFDRTVNTKTVGSNGYAYIAADAEWDFLENKNEIYVISMDVTANGTPDMTSDQGAGDWLRVYMRDDAETVAHFSPSIVKLIAKAENAGFQLGFEPKMTNESGVTESAIYPSNEAHRLAYGIFYNEKTEDDTQCTSTRRATYDGVRAFSDNSDIYTKNATALPGKSIISGIQVGYHKNQEVSIGKLRMYTIDKTEGAFNISTTATTDVPEATEKITVKFSQPVSAATFDKTAVTVSENDVAMAAADYKVSDLREVISEGKIWSEVDVEIDLDYDSNYVITFPETVSNEMAMALGENNTVTFETETAPSFNITLNAFEGLAEGSAITADAMAGKTVYFKANATNTTGRAVAGDVAIGIYDANGNLIKVAFANKAFETAGANTFAAAFKMKDGYTAKAFVKGTASTVTFQ